MKEQYRPEPADDDEPELVAIDGPVDVTAAVALIAKAMGTEEDTETD